MIQHHDLSGNSLDQVLANYLEAVNSGKGSGRSELLARHPDLVAGLEAFFADEDRFLCAVGPMRAVYWENAVIPETVLPETVSYTPRATKEIPLPWKQGLPNYTIVGTLGHGGQGMVYKARHEPLHRWVALKVVRAGELADPKELARFQQEGVFCKRSLHEHATGGPGRGPAATPPHRPGLRSRPARRATLFGT